MNNLKKSLAGALLALAVAASPTANAAQASITVDVDLPTVLIMYHFTEIDLSVTEQVLVDYMTGDTSSACTGGGRCFDQGTSDLGGIADLAAANEDAGLGDTAPALANTTADVTVQNVVGVRAIGCSTYSAVVADGGSDTGVTVDTTSLDASIDSQACSLSMTTGDLSFELDFEQVSSGSTNAVFDVTITGV